MRGLFGKLATRSGTANPEDWFREFLLGGQSSHTGIVISQMRALHDVTCMACVSIRAADLAKLPVHVYRMKNGAKVILRDHALERLLRKPNSWQTWFEFLEQMQAAFLLRGNTYAPIVRDGRNAPMALIPVSPERVVIYETSDGELLYEILRHTQHDIAVLAGVPQRVPAEDVLHLRWMSFNGLLGLSRIGLARDAIGLSLAQEEQAARLLANGMKPPMVFETDKRLSDPVFKRFQAQLKEKYSGLANTGEVPILEEGLKAKPMGLSFVEMEMTAAREQQIKQIAMAFDVPLHRLGIAPNGGGPAILQAHQMYLNNTLSADAERWEAKLNDAFGLDGEEEFVEFDLDYFNRADQQTRLMALRTGVIGSILKINEARRSEGLPEVEGGDTLLQPTNMAPFPFIPAAPGSGPGSDTTGAPAPGGDGDPAAADAVEDDPAAVKPAE